MIISRILPAAGFLTLLTFAAFAQGTPIPVGAGANADHPGVGSRTEVPHPTKHPPAAQRPHGKQPKAVHSKRKQNAGH
jgi:hypothetical protein